MGLATLTGRTLVYAYMSCWPWVAAVTAAPDYVIMLTVQPPGGSMMQSPQRRDCLATLSLHSIAPPAAFAAGAAPSHSGTSPKTKP
ncbi:hypothetical protein LSAT2_030087 [Lamellibrachia satsuma]|nr:hypothetical protein LSAT2_030087 [Lamellibrachia satsuma]